MAEAAFSEDGKYYSAISGDGRLRIWDTETNVLKQEYTPDLHLTAPPSCLQWITVAQSTSKQTKKRSSISENESQCIVLGTFSGKLLIYSVSQSKVLSVFDKGGGKITCLDWNRKYGLYSCNKESNLCEWNLQGGNVRHKYKLCVDSKSKQGNQINAIKIIPHKLETKATYLIAASWQVRLWRLNSGECNVVKTLGHNASETAVLALACLNDVCWLVQGSQNERLLSFWDVTITEDHQPQVNGDDTPVKKKRKKSLTNVPIVSSPSYNFVLEDAPKSVDVGLREEDGTTKLSLAATTRSGVVHYYGHTLNGSSSKPFKPSVTVHTTTPEAVPLPVQCSRLQDNGTLLVGWCNGPVIEFECVTPDLKTKTQILIRGDSKPAKRSKQQNEGAKTEVTPTQVQVLEPMGGVVSRKRTVPGGEIEVPMEARLANLSIDLKVRRTAAVNENLTKLLVQGLHSKDLSIIRSVVYKNSASVALRTVSGLPAQYVSPLLDQLAAMAHRNTALCASVCTWLQALLRCHSALLLAIINSQRTEQLTQLLAIFTHRRSHLCQLMNLKGRLDLTIKQRSNAAEAHIEQKPVLEYNDTSDEEILAEDNKSDSDASWDDDKFEGSDEEQVERDDSDAMEDDE